MRKLCPLYPRKRALQFKNVDDYPSRRDGFMSFGELIERYERQYQYWRCPNRPVRR